MAYIKSFIVDGLAGRDSPLERHLNRDVNIFFGLNGSGKTSLLKILHSALSNDISILKNVPFKSAEIIIYSVNLKADVTYRIEQIKSKSNLAESIWHNESVFQKIGESEFYPNISSIQPRWSTISEAKITTSQTWNHVYLPISRLYLGGRISTNTLFNMGRAGEQLSEEALDAMFQESVEVIWTNYSNSVLSDVRKIQEDGLANILKSVLTYPDETMSKSSDALDPQIGYERVQSFLKRRGTRSSIGSFESFSDKFSRNPQMQNIVNQINNVEQRIDEATAPRKKLESLTHEMLTGNKRVEFSDRNITVTGSDSEKLSLASLSSGEKQLLRIIIEAVRAGEGPVLIDEPELSMHIDWQRSLVKSIRDLNPHSQLIIATHSPEIMAEVSDKRIFRI